MRKVPPGIQIILSMSEGLSQMVTSDVSLAVGCAVIKALPPPIIDMVGIGYVGESPNAIGPWSNIETDLCDHHGCVVVAERETGLALRVNVASLILLTEY